MTKIPQHSTIFWDSTDKQYYTTYNNTPTGRGRSTTDPYVLDNGKPLSFNQLIGTPPKGRATSGANAPQFVMVQPGDSEWAIAQQYAEKSGDVAKLWGSDIVPGNTQFSNPNLIYAGDIAVINPSSSRNPVQAGQSAQPQPPSVPTIQHEITRAMASHPNPTTSYVRTTFAPYLNGADFPNTLAAMKNILGENIKGNKPAKLVKWWISGYLSLLHGTAKSEAESGFKSVIKNDTKRGLPPNYGQYGV
jgi:hypothetical protein